MSSFFLSPQKEKTLARKLTQEQLLQQARNVLEHPFAIPEIDTKRLYHRIHDDNDGDESQQLAVLLAPDGDVWVQALHPPYGALRFRVPIIGGGQSPRVHAALKLLALAIKLDNEEPLKY